jgi:hypothetical protein
MHLSERVRGDEGGQLSDGMLRVRFSAAAFVDGQELREWPGEGQPEAIPAWPDRRLPPRFPRFLLCALQSGLLSSALPDETLTAIPREAV